MELPATPKASLLLVDDHQGNLVTLEAILAPLGHELVPVLSGEEALGQLLRRSFALILLDVQMAGMNGFELAGIGQDAHFSTLTASICYGRVSC